MAVVESEHDALVASYTGGMAPDLSSREFAGSERLRPDGRPRPELRAELRRIPDFMNTLTTLWAVVLPVLIVLAARFMVGQGQWWFLAIAFVTMGLAQNAMFILHHEAAHRLLFSNRRINDLIGITGIGWLAFGTGTHHYRRGHANHHRDEFGPKEPDFVLYSFYPIATASLRRKFRRDVSGVSAYRIVRPRFTGLVKPEFRGLSLRFFAGQAVTFALFLLAGVPWMYLVLWVVPYASVYQVVNRLRAIAEHGGMTRSPDRRRTTHHVEQRWLARLLMVPYGVGYHVAHHVDSGIPFRNLRRFHDILEADGYITADLRWPNYRSLWTALAAGPSTAEA